MNKMQFLLELDKMLSQLSETEKVDWLRFYSEMIEDRMEEGLSEEEAVAAIGTVRDIAAQITADQPAGTAKKRNPWMVLLLILGSPIWIAILASLFAVVLTLYISLWAIVISLWAVFASLAACGLAGVAGGIGFACGGHVLPGIALSGAGLVCAGLAILLFFGCRAATKGTAILGKKIFILIKKCFRKKEGNLWNKLRHFG